MYESDLKNRMALLVIIALGNTSPKFQQLEHGLSYDLFCYVLHSTSSKMYPSNCYNKRVLLPFASVTACLFT